MDKNSFLNIVEECFGDYVKNIDLDQNFESMDIDSIDLLDFIMSIEDNFGVEFSEEELERTKTVNQLWDLLNEKK